MPVVASPTHQGWIKVSPPRRNPQISKAKQEAALRGPLAYFSCQPVPTKVPTKLPPCPKYDLEDDGHPYKHQGGGGGGGKNRTVSAPARHGHRGVYYDDDEGGDPYDDQRHDEHTRRHRRSPPSRDRSRPPAHQSPHTHTSHQNHRTAPAAAQPRAVSNYWTGPTKKHTPSPRSYTSSHTGSSSSRSTASARWANATAPLDLG